jgi:hypothetical protein
MLEPARAVPTMLPSTPGASGLLLPYESDMNRKLLTETTETGLFGFVDSNGSQGAAGTRRESFSSVQVTSVRRIGKNHGNPRG